MIGTWRQEYRKLVSMRPAPGPAARNVVSCQRGVLPAAGEDPNTEVQS